MKKQFIITKTVLADNINDAIKNEKKGEVREVYEDKGYTEKVGKSLPSAIGFNCKEGSYE